MATITFKGDKVETAGTLPAVGGKAPGFSLVNGELGEVTLDSLAGKNIVLNIFPSVDTPVCAASVKRFNTDAAGKDNTVVLCISADLPFAQGRFCAAEGIENVTSLSTFRSPEFGTDYGVVITTSALAGLLSRAVVVIGEDGTVKYTEQVPEIAQEPDYEAALGAI
ncbi:MAG: thiol peroxidase [Planctomycetota bacterium]